MFPNVPSLNLLSQFYSDWVNQSYAENKKIRYLLIGSDADVDEAIKYKPNDLILYIDPKFIKELFRIKNYETKCMNIYYSISIKN